MAIRSNGIGNDKLATEIYGTYRVSFTEMFYLFQCLRLFLPFHIFFFIVYKKNLCASFFLISVFVPAYNSLNIYFIQATDPVR